MDDIEGINFSEHTHDFHKILLMEEDRGGEKEEIIHSFLADAPLDRIKVPRQVLDLLKASIPNVAIMLGVFYYSFINLLFVRLIGDAVLVASFGMGVTWYNATCLCFLIAIGNGLFIQLAQAYGAKNYKRCQGILITAGIVSSILMFNTKLILMAVGINEEIAEYTSQFSVACIPSIFGTVMFDTSKQLLISQNIFDIPMKVQLTVYFIHPFWCFLLTQVFDFGIMGIGLARGLSEYMGFFLIKYLIEHRKLCPLVWNYPYNLRIMFSEWIPFLKIAVPVGCLIFLEWIFFEISTIIVGKLNDDKILAGHVAFQAITMFFFMAPAGLCWTSSSFLGNAVGSGKRQVCESFSKIIMVACLALGIAFMILGEILKESFFYIFATDPEMGRWFRYAYNMYLYGFLLPDYFQAVLNGILRCCNKQNSAAFAYLCVYYVIGVPMAIFLTFCTDLKLGGVWITQTFVASIVSIYFFYQIFSIDWDRAIKEVQSRVQVEEAPADIDFSKTYNNGNTPSCSLIKLSGD